METRLNEKAVTKLNDSLHALCIKARSENMPLPFKARIIDPNDPGKLWERDVKYDNETNTFSWEKSYEDFSGHILSLELEAANGLLIGDHIRFDEEPKQMEAAAAAD